MKLEELQKIVDERTYGPWQKSKVDFKNKLIMACGGDLGQVVVGQLMYDNFNDQDFIIAVENHIDEIMDVLRAAQRCLEDNSGVRGFFPGELAKALDKLERK